VNYKQALKLLFNWPSLPGLIQKGLQQLIDNLNKVTQKFGMKINVKKNKSDMY